MDDQDLDRLLAQVRRIEEHREKGAEAEIRKAYQELMKELRHYLADAYTQYAEEDRLSYAILQKHGYYARFLEEVEQKINDISPEVKRTIRSTVDQTYEYTYNGMIDCVKKAAPDTTVTAGLKACTPDVIRRAVENPVSKLTLNDRLEKHRKEIIYDIKRDISIGLMNGDRYSAMANRIRKSVDGDYKKAIRIARTETHRVREAGNHDAAQAVDEVLKSGESGMQMVKTWRTKKDERVRPAKAKGKNRQYNHKKMDGVAIPVDEEFTLPSGAKTVAPGQSGVAGEDINCRCYLSYKMQKTLDMSDNGAQGRKPRKRSVEELQEANERARTMTEKYSTRASKWSGNVIVNDDRCKKEKILGRKLWSCDILIRSTTSDKTIIHEHLHARSASHLSPISYLRHSKMEESSVELLARKICENESIPYASNAHQGVDALLRINRLVKIRDDDLDFAISLFGKDLRRRHKWLSDMVGKRISNGDIGEKEISEVWDLVELLKG